MPVLRPRFVGAVLALAIAGCALNRAPGPPYRTYHILAAISADGPSLNRAQLGWLGRVMISRNYANEVSDLRFVPIRGVKTPLVVYLRERSFARDGGHVIGEGCDVYFDADRGIVQNLQACQRGAPPEVE